MRKLPDFRLGVDVVASDGSKAGTLVSVLVDKEGFDPRAVVVKDEVSLMGRLMAEEKLFITDEVVIPIAAVESATHDQIRLSMSVADIRRQPPYISYRFKPPTEGSAVLQEAEMLGGGLGMPSAEEIANKETGEIEIEGGENVMLGKTGRRFGRVQEVLYDQGEFLGVVIQPDGFFKKEVVLPKRFITRADDLALFVHLEESDIERLQPFIETD